MITVTQVI